MTGGRRSSLRNVVLLTIGALLPVVPLAGCAIVLASDQVTSVVDKQVQTTATVSSVVIGQQTARLLALVASTGAAAWRLASGGRRD